MQNTKTPIKKPIGLRVTFLLNAFMSILPFIFYYIVTSKNIQLGTLQPIWMVYTGIAYLISFLFFAISLAKRLKIIVFVIPLINILISLPANR